MDFKIRKKSMALFFSWFFSALVINAIFSVLNPYLGLLPANLNLVATGLIIAVIQWLVLRNFIDQAHLWGIFTFIGLSLSSFLVNTFNPQIGNLFAEFYNGEESFFYLFIAIFQAVQGGFIGFIQYFALKGLSPRALWWVLFSALASSISGSANLFYLNFVSIASSGGQITQAQEIFRNILVSGLNAIVMVLGLLWILKKVLHSDNLEEALEEFDFDGPEGDL